MSCKGVKTKREVLRCTDFDSMMWFIKYNSLIYADEQKKSYEYDMYENGSGKDITSDEAVKSEGDNLKEADGTDLFRTSNMGISQSGVDLIKQFEGCRLTAYKVTSSEKYYTIGYGHYGADGKMKNVLI